MLRRVSLVALMLASPVAMKAAFAQDADGGVGDAGGFDSPDGSVGTGGADRDNEENEDAVGRVPTVCQETRDCAPAFRCEAGRCRYVGVRDADGGFGCGCTSGPSFVPIFALAVWQMFTRKRCAPTSC